MKVTVRYFASLRDRMGCADKVVELDGSAVSVAEVWAKAASGQDMPESTLMAINMNYTDVDALLKDGDELAFFPPVTGG